RCFKRVRLVAQGFSLRVLRRKWIAANRWNENDYTDCEKIPSCLRARLQPCHMCSVARGFSPGSPRCKKGIDECDFTGYGKPVLLKGTASSVPHVLCCKGL